MGRDKALLPFQGSTFLNHLIALFLLRVSPVIVVLGHHADAIRESITAGESQNAADLRVVINADYRLGMLSSFQTGIRALPQPANAAMFTLVDLPAVRESTLDRLLGEFEGSGQPLAIPRYQGRRGHPVVAARAILEEMLGLALEDTPKSVVRAHRADTRFVDVDDPGIIRDIDLPEEYEELKASWKGNTSE